MNRMLIRGGEIVTPLSRYRADIGIEGSIISEVGRDLPDKGRKVIDARGKLVLPGVIDAHTHMALPMQDTRSCDTFFTGTRAAAFGGVTSIIDFTEMASGADIIKAFRKRKKEAAESVIDFGLHACIRGFSKATAKRIESLVAMGITSFKMFTVYKERGLMSDDGSIYDALQTISGLGALVTLHCENDSIVDLFTGRTLESGQRKAAGLAASRPNIAEGEAVQRAVTLAEASGGRLYVVHVSTKEGLRAIVEGRKRGVNVTAETCPQYLLLDDGVLSGRNGHRWAAVPPLRTPVDTISLWEGLAEGEFSVVATDHCPFTKAQKDKHRRDFTKLPFGLPGVETLLPLLYTYGVGRGIISVNQLTQVLSSNPAMIFGLYPAKGIIQPGSDADLVIFDPARKVTIKAARLHMNTDFSPYQGFSLTGWPETTISRGNIIVDKGRFYGKAGQGRYLHREPS